MKKTTKLTVVLLALVITLLFAGCNAKGTGKKSDTDSEKFEGKWFSTVSVSEFISNIAGDADGEFIEIFQDLDENLTVTLEFKDGKVTTVIDASAAFESDSFRDIAKGLATEQIESLYEMSLEELENEEGLTFEEILQEEFEMTLDEYIDETVSVYKDSVNAETTTDYELKDGKLYIDVDAWDYTFESDDHLIIDMPDFGELEFKRD